MKTGKAGWPVPCLTPLVLGLFALAPIVQGAFSRRQAVSPDFSITTNPALVPAFNPAIQNYAIRCTGSPTRKSPRWHGSGDGGGDNLPWAGDPESAAGRGNRTSNHQRRHLVLRPLPSERLSRLHRLGDGQPQQAKGYMAHACPYIVVFDTDGVHRVVVQNTVDPLLRSDQNSSTNRP